jgi:hypothetical protein
MISGKGVRHELIIVWHDTGNFVYTVEIDDRKSAGDVGMLLILLS